MAMSSATRVAGTVLKRPAAPTDVVLKRPSGSAPPSSMWSADPALAASLALSPLGAEDRRITGSLQQASSSSSSESTAIERQLPPALLSLKMHGEWSKNASNAVQEYLLSLKSREGIDVESILAAYKSAKPKDKKPLAMKLCMATTSGDLKAIDKEYVSESTTKESKKGWLSAYEIWSMEKIPMVPETIDTRVACLSVLERRAHENPLRAAMGEFMFLYEKQMLDSHSETHGHSISSVMTQKCKDGEDFTAGRSGIRRAFDKSDQARESAPKTMKVAKAPKTVADMTSLEKKCLLLVTPRRF